MSDDDAFLAGLTGRAQAAHDLPDAHAGAAALREALQARRDVLKEAERIRLDPPPLTTEEAARLESVVTSFRRQGLFGRKHAHVSPPAAVPAGLLETLRRFFGSGASWPRGLAVAACMVVAVTVGLQLLPEAEGDRGALRGGTQPFINAAEPGQRAEQLAGELRKLGANVVLTPIHNTEWNLDVEVPLQADRARIVRALAAAGAKVPEFGNYKIVVRSGGK